MQEHYGMDPLFEIHNPCINMVKYNAIYKDYMGNDYMTEMISEIAL